MKSVTRDRKNTSDTSVRKVHAKGSVNVWAFWPAFIGLLILLFFNIFYTDKMAEVLNGMLYGMADHIGWLINLFALSCFLVVIYILISKYGDIRIGGAEAKPEFSMFSWIAMTICGSIGTGLLFWAMGEPLYNFYQPPAYAGCEPGTRDAAIFAVSQVMWQWSFVEFSLYAVCSVAFTVAIYNRRKKMRFNSVLDPVFGRRQWLETLIHAVMIFAMVGGCANSMGVGLMQIGAGLESAFSIKQTNLIYLLIAVFIGAMFVIMSVSGIHKGLKYVSTATFFIFIAFLVYVFICGDTTFIGKIVSESIGKILDNWGSKTLINNTLSEDTWYADWIVQYWASFILYCPVFGMFFCRMAKGRTIRQFLLVNVVVPSVFCIIWIGIFGGMTISLQTSGKMDVWAMVQQYGMQTTVYQIIKALPFGDIVQVIFIIAIVGSFTTMADPVAAVLATMSVHNLTAEDEAPKKFKIIMGLLITATAYATVATDGVNAVKAMWVILGAPVMIIVGICVVSFFKQANEIRKYPDEMLPESAAEDEE